MIENGHVGLFQGWERSVGCGQKSSGAKREASSRSFMFDDSQTDGDFAYIPFGAVENLNLQVAIGNNRRTIELG